MCVQCLSSQGLFLCTPPKAYYMIMFTVVYLMWLCGSSAGGIALTDKGLHVGCGCYGLSIQFKWSCMIVVNSLGIKAAD